jgi:BirA family transcriptional regulator, biotin operon repressor / biotin---[acetyl-CoA-carboxylase] ligase
MAPHCPGLDFRVLAQVDSSNTCLLDMLRSSAEPCRTPLLLVAEHQRSGRGRQGRRWASQHGASLTFSLAWPLQTNDLSGLSLAVGVALAEALDPHRGRAPRIALKWPNDLWLLDAAPASGQAGGAPGRKLGGILIETLHRDTQHFAVIGIGLNIRPVAVDDPSSGVACLQEIDPRLDAPGALHQVAPPLVRALREFESAGFAAFAAGYRHRDLLFGRDVRAGVLDGVADGVAANGALRLRRPEGVQTILSGEVSVRFIDAGAAPRPVPC